MNAELLYAAGKIVSNDHILVNIMRLRVRQLTRGSRPLVVAPPGLGTADIALMEIIQQKISFAPLEEENASDVIVPAPVLQFPDLQAKKKAA